MHSLQTESVVSTPGSRVATAATTHTAPSPTQLLCWYVRPSDGQKFRVGDVCDHFVFDHDFAHPETPDLSNPDRASEDIRYCDASGQTIPLPRDLAETKKRRGTKSSPLLQPIPLRELVACSQRLGSVKSPKSRAPALACSFGRVELTLVSLIATEMTNRWIPGLDCERSFGTSTLDAAAMVYCTIKIASFFSVTCMDRLQSSNPNVCVWLRNRYKEMDPDWIKSQCTVLTARQLGALGFKLPNQAAAPIMVGDTESEGRMTRRAFRSAMMAEGATVGLTEESIEKHLKRDEYFVRSSFAVLTPKRGMYFAHCVRRFICEFSESHKLGAETVLLPDQYLLNDLFVPDTTLSTNCDDAIRCHNEFAAVLRQRFPALSFDTNAGLFSVFGGGMID